MFLKIQQSKIKYILFLLKKKGLAYVFNKIRFSILYGTKNPILIKFIHLFSPYPSYIEIETTTRCNLKCVFCEHSYWDEKEKDMTFTEFKEIVDQFPKLKWIGLTSIGESFLNKDFLKILEYVKSKNIFVELYDNFFLINKDVAEKLIELQIDKIFISLDAATKKTYEKIRIGSDFEKVINNIKYFIRLKKERELFFPEIAFHFVITQKNFREMSQYIELVHSIAGRNANIQFSNMLHGFKEVENLFMKIPEEMKQTIENKAKQLSIKISWNADTTEIKPSIRKCTQWLMPFIFATGEVIPCCSSNEANQRYLQKETSLGNIFEKSFKDIWYGKKYENFRKTLQHGKIPTQCKNCCLYNIINK